MFVYFLITVIMKLQTRENYEKLCFDGNGGGGNEYIQDLEM